MLSICKDREPFGVGGVLKGMEECCRTWENIRQESKRIQRVCREVKKCRNNKTVSVAGSQAECEGRVQIKRRIGDLEVSQLDFTVFFITPPLFPYSLSVPRSFGRKYWKLPCSERSCRGVEEGLLKRPF